MPRRQTLTQNHLAKLPRRAKRYYMADPVQQGLILRIPPQGPIGYSAVAWRGGKQSWMAVGSTATISWRKPGRWRAMRAARSKAACRAL